MIPRDHWRFARLGDGQPVPESTFLCMAAEFEAGNYSVAYTGHGAIGHAYALGVSQSAHFLREFLDLGLNEDEQQRQIFDGVLLVVGSARRGEFNVRFGQPGKTHRVRTGCKPAWWLVPKAQME